MAPGIADRNSEVDGISGTPGLSFSFFANFLRDLGVKGHHRSRSGSNSMVERWRQALVAEISKLRAFFSTPSLNFTFGANFLRDLGVKRSSKVKVTVEFDG